MSLLNIETFLDYNEVIKVVFEIVEGKTNYHYECNSNNEKLKNNILQNLQKISTTQDFPDSCVLSINKAIFIIINKENGKVAVLNRLTAFESRLLSQSRTDGVPYPRDYLKGASVKTDLHTHFAGALTPESLLKVGLKHDIDYPIDLLESIGIDVSRYGVEPGGSVKLSELTPNDLRTLQNNLAISPVTQDTFGKMEEIYGLRKPFTKNISLLPDLLRELAQDYKSQCIQYVELSLADFLKPEKALDCLKIIDEVLPQIEAEFGVKIRFLAAIRRSDVPEKRQDNVDKIVALSQSKYIVGCDFMGHETTPTIDFEQELRMLVRHCMLNDPHFTIRVHAGENPLFRSNVYDALKIIDDEYQKICAEKNKELPRPCVRIGHGLYGADIDRDGKGEHVPDGAVIELMKKTGAIIEFNMSSNLALNNVNELSTIPIKRYSDAGIRVVLCTDGHGLYRTTTQQEIILAAIAGLIAEDFHKIQDTEELIMDDAKDRDKEHSESKKPEEILEAITYSTSDKKPRLSSKVKERYKKKEEKDLKTLDSKYENFGATTDEEEIESDTEGKTPILICGGSKISWPHIHPRDQGKIALTLHVLAKVLNPEKAYLVIRGTNTGIDKEVLNAVRDRNSHGGQRMTVLGTYTEEAIDDIESGMPEDTITHAMLLKSGNKPAKKWSELPDTQLEYIRKRKGVVIAMGGGIITADLIQKAYNIGLDLHLMDGPYGASSDESVALFGNDVSFTTVAELVVRLYKSHPELFAEGISIENLMTYIEQSQEEIIQSKFLNVVSNFGLGALANIDKLVSDRQRRLGISKIRRAIREQERALQYNKEVPGR